MNQKMRGSKPFSRRWWFTIHSWIGLKLSLLTCFVFVTGTLATVSHDIDWLLNPDRRVSIGEVQVSWGEIVAAAHEARPDWHLSVVIAPVERWFAAEVQGYTPEGEGRRLYVDPYTGKFQGEAGWVNVQRVLRQAHRHLMLPVKIGVPLVSIAALVLTISMVTGVIAYKKWWRGFRRSPRSRDLRTFWGDTHRLLGVWSLPFGVIIALTGWWYLIENFGLDAPVPRAVMSSQRVASVLNVPKLDAITLNEAVERATAAYPSLDVRFIRLPLKAGASVLIEGNAEALLVRPRANRVSIDPMSGDVLSMHKGVDLSMHQRISEMADPLHFGSFGGFATRLLYLVFGTVLSVLSISGVYLYGCRIARDEIRTSYPTQLIPEVIEHEPF